MLARVKILIAEDNADLRDIMVHVLVAEGAEVECVSDGRMAIEFATDGSFDIILMDLTLPKVSGEMAMQTLKQSGIVIPIIALSAYPESEKKSQCLGQGFDDYISKPFELDAFIDKIKANLVARWP